MTWNLPNYRKQRTREHVIADQSLNYLERFVLDEGHAIQRTERDYGYDLVLYTFDENGYVEPSMAFLQLKASDSPLTKGAACGYDLDVRDYNLWKDERMPVFLVLFDAKKRQAYWLYVQRYFAEDASRRPRKGAKTIRVYIPWNRRINRRAITMMTRIKRDVLRHYPLGAHHA